MGQKFSCGCGRRLAVKSSFQGSSVKCPSCGAQVTVPGGSDFSISIPGIHSERSQRRAAKKPQPWLVPVACTLLGAVLTAIVWPLLTSWLSSDLPNQHIRIGGESEVTNPFAQ